jgi:hypothetical protein
MAENKSMYSRGGSGMTTGGLDGILGPQAPDFSNLPEHIENLELDEPEIAVDCDGKDKDEAVCQIAAAETEKSEGKV